MNDEQRNKARRFHALHGDGKLLVLLNAWDAASARVFELAGATAIATTSGGVAATHGFPDGQHLSRELLIATVRDITRTVAIPVSIDLEAGYGTTTSEIAESVREVIAAGGIGINIEDQLRDPSVLAERIGAIRAVAAEADLPLFINARTDVYLARKGSAAEQLDDAIRRLRLYEQAGADGLFAPGLGDGPTITAILREITRPLNIMAGPGVPPVGELARLGVRRLSVGSGPSQATLALTRRIAEDVLQNGGYDSFLADRIPYAEVNAMFATKRS